MTETYWELQFFNRRKPGNNWQVACEHIPTEEKAIKLRNEMMDFYDNEDFGLEYRIAKVVKTVIIS